MAFVKVFSGGIIEVQHIKQLLQKKGIEPIVKDNTFSAAISGFGAVVPDFQELLVHSDEELKVREILSSL